MSPDIPALLPPAGPPFAASSRGYSVPPEGLAHIARPLQNASSLRQYRLARTARSQNCFPPVHFDWLPPAFAQTTCSYPSSIRSESPSHRRTTQSPARTGEPALSYSIFFP